MQNSDTEIATRLGAQAFEGVTDKAGQPYWGHCLRVADRARTAGLGDAAIAAALLHDVVEDKLATFDQLASSGLSARAIDLIRALTRPKDADYIAYVAKIAESGDRDLILIKLADNADNCDPARIALLPQGIKHNSDRYAAAREVLLPALNKTTK